MNPFYGHGSTATETKTDFMLERGMRKRENKETELLSLRQEKREFFFTYYRFWYHIWIRNFT